MAESFSITISILARSMFYFSFTSSLQAPYFSLFRYFLFTSSLDTESLTRDSAPDHFFFPSLPLIIVLCFNTVFILNRSIFLICSPCWFTCLCISFFIYIPQSFSILIPNPQPFPSLFPFSLVRYSRNSSLLLKLIALLTYLFPSYFCAS